MDTAGGVPMGNSLGDKILEFLTKPRGKVGRVRAVRMEADAKIEKMDQMITLNGDETWFQKACRGDDL